jgi:hypothetical protein
MMNFLSIRNNYISAGLFFQQRIRFFLKKNSGRKNLSADTADLARPPQPKTRKSSLGGFEA